MKKVLKVALALIVLFTIVTMTVGCGSVTSSIFSANGWTFTANSSNGESSTHMRSFTAEELESLYVESSVGSGSVALILTQGGNEREFDISGEFSGHIDTSEFIAGQISLQMRFDNARDVDISITW